MHLALLGTMAVASSLILPSIELAHAAMSSAPHDAYNTHLKVGNEIMQSRLSVQLVRHRGGGDRRSFGGGGDRRSFGGGGGRQSFGGGGGRQSFNGGGDRRRIYRGGSGPRAYSRQGDFRHSGKNYRRFQSRRPGYTYFYGGWWYPFPWWIATAPYYYETAPYYYETPVYGDRCDYWHDRCVANWGYRNSDYYGCMRYYGCY
jgi:hypothetical protein